MIAPVHNCKTTHVKIYQTLVCAQKLYISIKTAKCKMASKCYTFEWQWPTVNILSIM